LRQRQVLGAPANEDKNAVLLRAAQRLRTLAPSRLETCKDLAAVPQGATVWPGRSADNSPGAG